MNTKKIILEAAFALLREEPFKNLTVQKILDRAEVSRRTFYKYFSDKHELMTYYYKDFADKNIIDNYNGHNVDDLLYELLIFIETNDSYFKNVKDTSGPDSFWDFIRTHSTKFYGSIKCHNEKRDFLTEEEQIVLLMFIEGHIAVLKLMLEKPVSLERRKLVKVLSDAIPLSYKEILDEGSSYVYVP